MSYSRCDSTKLYNHQTLKKLVMRKLLPLVILITCLTGSIYAQQDAMFTNYVFNALNYNPAYAGSKDHMAIGALHRTQWWGINGAPSTQSVFMHTPLKNDRVGIGFNLFNDAIGPTNNLGVNVSYAYRIPIGENGARLSIGIQGGIENFRSDWDELILDDSGDGTFLNSPNLLLPNFGGGIYYYSKYFYAGLSVPHLVENSLRAKEDDINTALSARQYRHYYFAMGTAIPLNGDDLIFKPSILVKNVGLDSKLRKDEQYQNIAAPTEFDIDLSLLFYETFWVGASFRSALEAFGSDPSSSYDSVDVWAQYMLNSGLRIGAGYDFTVSGLSRVASGSFEIMLGYEFDYEENKTVTPRYF